MSQSILIFDFGSNEEAAQQARHKLEGWKQAFRLGDKLQLKFERVESEESAESGADEKPASAKKGATGKSQAKKASAEKNEDDEKKSAEAPAHIRILIRLDFSDHEKLSHQRWIERIPTDEPFKGANPQVIRAGEPQFKPTSDLFDSLD